MNVDHLQLGIGSIVEAKGSRQELHVVLDVAVIAAPVVVSPDQYVIQQAVFELLRADDQPWAGGQLDVEAFRFSRNVVPAVQCERARHFAVDGENWLVRTAAPLHVA